MLRAEQETVVLARIEVELIIASPPPPDALTVPWATAVPPDVVSLKKLAVPVAAAAVSEVMALAVFTPALAAVNGVLDSVSVDRSTAAPREASAFAGTVPL